MNRVIFALVLLLSSQAIAQWLWEPKTPIKIYTDKDLNATPLLEVPLGESINILKPQKADEDGWVEIIIVNQDSETKGYVQRNDISRKDMTKIKPKKSRSEGGFSRIIGAGISVIQTIRGETSSTASGGQVVNFGPQYGVTAYPTLFFEFPSKERGSYRIFASYRMQKSKGEVTLSQSGVVTSKELMEQTHNFAALGFLFRQRISGMENYWYGYGMELAKGIAGEQVYSDGTTTNLKDTLPTNFYLQTSVGRQSATISSWHFLPEIKFGVIANNKPITVNIELLFNFSLNL